MRQHVIAFGLIALIALAAAHHTLGLSVVRVTSASMEPTYRVGQLLLVHVVDASKVAPGDVPLVRPEAQSPPVVHRIVEISGSTAITRGDANSSTDSWSVPLSGRVPVVMAAAPSATASLTESPARLLLAIAALVAIGAGLPRRTTRSATTPTTTAI